MTSLCYVAVLLWGVDGPALSEGMALELKALEARRALQNGVVELSVEYLKAEEGPPGAQQDSIPSVDLKITFDGNRRFVECRHQGSTRSERRMFDGSLYIVEDGDQSAKERITIDSRGLAGSRYLVLDPRLLGVYPLTFPSLSSNPHSLDEVLGRTDRTEEQVHVEQMSGRSVTHVSRKVLSGQVQVDLWIAPELNYSVVKVQVESPTIKRRTELHSEYDKPFGKVWFPQRITLREYRTPDNQLTTDETITVKSAGARST